MQNSNFTDSLITDIILVTSQEFDIFKMAFRMVADKFTNQRSNTLPVGVADGFVTYQIPCLMEKHYKYTYLNK